MGQSRSESLVDGVKGLGSFDIFGRYEEFPALVMQNIDLTKTTSSLCMLKNREFVRAYPKLRRTL